MKLSKPKKIILIVLIFTMLLYPLIFQMLFVMYESLVYGFLTKSWEENVIKRDNYEERSVRCPNITTFFETVYGETALCLGLALTASWVITLIKTPKPKLSKFNVVVLALSGVIVSGIVFVCAGILNLEHSLNFLYWIAENTHSGMVGMAIELTEAKLHQELMFLTGLVLTMIVLLSIVLRYRKVKKPELTILEACSPPSPE